jgi:hypothetical protein
MYSYSELASSRSASSAPSGSEIDGDAERPRVATAELGIEPGDLVTWKGLSPKVFDQRWAYVVAAVRQLTETEWRVELVPAEPNPCPAQTFRLYVASDEPVFPSLTLELL